VGETVAILVMDTATEALAVAIGQEREVIASSVFRVPRGHSRILQPAISHLLSQTGTDLASITGIAVGIGPGSYTGVRLAVSTAKAMAITLGVPLYPTPTLFGIAGATVPERHIRHTLVMPLLFARRGRAFGGFYLKKQNGAFECIKGSTVMSVEDWCNEARALQQKMDADLVVVHDFLQKHGVLELLDSLENACVMPLCTVAGELGTAFIHLAASGVISPVTGDAIHHVVPEYALEVEAEKKLREGRLGVHE
jgi:tRNA threonylcarbamoyladenosine biosynthesis protein TsaB